MADLPPILLLRHGQTDWNAQGRLQGRTDVALNAEGIFGARRAARDLAGWGVTRILCSPLIRATQTARIVAAATGTPVAADPRLIERDFGTLEGMLHRDILAGHDLSPDFALRDGLPGGAEPWASVKARMRAACQDLAGASGPVLIVSHLAALTALAEAFGLTPPVFENSKVIALSHLSRLARDIR